jgi:hypothetical protein
MKILITGTKGLAQALSRIHALDHVICVSRSTGHNILDVEQWGHEFKDFDRVYNCAYDGWGQCAVLEYFFDCWQQDQTKCIVNIGSKAITQPRIEINKDREYWHYRTHKQTLQGMCDGMWPTAKCDIKMFNPGPIDTDMIAHHNVPKLSITEVSEKIVHLSADHTIKRVDLWL